MALNQEFWLQKRRQEAKNLQKAATGGSDDGWKGSGYAAKAAAKAAAPQMWGAEWSQAAAPQMWGAEWSPSAASTSSPVQPVMNIAPQGGFDPFMQQSMAQWGSDAWTGALGTQVGVPAPLIIQAATPTIQAEAHKDWNSDDEDVDEFGRKKKRRKSAAPVTGSAAKQRRTSSDAPASSKPEAVESDARCEDQGEARPEAKESDASRKGKKKELSAKQQAALERLHGRSKKGPQAASEEGVAPQGDVGVGDTAAAQATPSAAVPIAAATTMAGAPMAADFSQLPQDAMSQAALAQSSPQWGQTVAPPSWPASQPSWNIPVQQQWMPPQAGLPQMDAAAAQQWEQQLLIQAQSQAHAQALAQAQTMGHSAYPAAMAGM